MYREEDIQKVIKIFNEMFVSELIKDDEVRQILKISKMLGKLNDGNQERSEHLDDIYKEILEFRHIIVDKYVKIGVCLESV